MQAEARGKMKLIRFAPNRVGRVYAGGAEIARLQGVEAPADGGCPEEWIASTVEAQGPRRPGEGVSRVLPPSGCSGRRRRRFSAPLMSPGSEKRRVS